MSSTKNVAGTATYINGDTTITITKVDGSSEPMFTVASTSAKVVTIPASFGRRRPKTGGDKSKMLDKSKSAESMNKKYDTHHADAHELPANRKPNTPCDNLPKRPNHKPYHPTTASERHILERALRHAHKFGKPGKGLIPPPTNNWSERPGPLPDWAQKAKEREEREDEDAYRGCGPEYDLHPDDDEDFTDVWYDDGE